MEFLAGVVVTLLIETVVLILVKVWLREKISEELSSDNHEEFCSNYHSDPGTYIDG